MTIISKSLLLAAVAGCVALLGCLDTSDSRKEIDQNKGLTYQEADSNLQQAMNNQAYIKAFELGCHQTLLNFAGFELADIDPWCATTYQHIKENLKEIK